jgi:hypothetical protein
MRPAVETIQYRAGNGHSKEAHPDFAEHIAIKERADANKFRTDAQQN